MLVATIAVLCVFALWWFTRAGELFCISVRDKKLLLVRGRAPAGFISEARAVVARAYVVSGTIRAFKTERGGRLVVSGAIDERTEQQLRNLFALYPASQLRQAPAIARPTVGQLLGIAWLAWLLDRSTKS